MIRGITVREGPSESPQGAFTLCSFMTYTIPSYTEVLSPFNAILDFRGGVEEGFRIYV
jgi:hypothetical protein